jgi:hypothetical protein
MFERSGVQSFRIIHGAVKETVISHGIDKGESPGVVDIEEKKLQE